MNLPADDAIEPYMMLRAALHLFQKPPAELNTEQRRQARRQAGNEYDLETRVLSSKEAAGVIIGDQAVAMAFAEVRGRFADEAGFRNALQANGLDAAGLSAALARECKVNAVLEKVAACAPKVDDVEIGIYYHSHPQKFHLSERRKARHILISINPAYPENTPDAALSRILAIAETLQRKPHKFAELALKHSECPTALHGGDLGTVPPGKLYAELDKVLFTLKRNEISKVVQTEMGFHLIQCLDILPAETVSLKNATPRIRQLMQERYRRNCQRHWLAGLPAAGR